MIEHSIEDGYLVIRIPLKIGDHRLDVKMAEAFSKFTIQEAKVFRDFILKGGARKEIADRLGISTRAVGFHLGNIYKKLGVDGMLEARRLFR